MRAKQEAVPLSEIRGKIDVTGICNTACPFLATEYDGITPMAFPHPGNRCFRHGDAQERQLQFQRAFCLSDEFEECQIFQEKGQPDIPEAKPNGRHEKSNGLRFWVPVIVVVVLFATIIFWPIMNRSFAFDRSISLPLALDQVWALMQDSPQTGEPSTPAVESDEFNKNDALDSSKNEPLQSDAALDLDTDTVSNKANGNFRAVQYRSD